MRRKAEYHIIVCVVCSGVVSRKVIVCMHVIYREMGTSSADIIEFSSIYLFNSDGGEKGGGNS